ncbi:glycosyl transferase [Rhizobium sp. CF122]|nr:glycosyl transferase [Rhizobium sp. CF122]
MGMRDDVAILMGTFQGARFLPEQLESIRGQTYSSWSLWVSDDGSTDTTLDLVRSFEKSVRSPVHVVNGPRRGFIRNFLTLICNPAIDAAYYAFSDQDDIWHADKLERAVAWLKEQPSSLPALYCSRTHTVDEKGVSTGNSPLFTRAPSFSNALVQSIGGGNTMVMNRAARALLIEGGAEADIPSHDWWAYILVSGAGGRVRYDAEPRIDYRQHASNIVGSNSGWRARLKRAHMLTQSRFLKWNGQHVGALRRVEHLLTPGNQALLADFRRMRTEALPMRLRILYRSGLHRQTLAGNFGLLVAVILKQI